MPRAHISGEHLPQKMLAHEWVDQQIKISTDPVDVYGFLFKNGKYFDVPRMRAPKGLPHPAKVIVDHCHSNNLNYIFSVLEHRPKLVKDMQFVSGIYCARAINPSVPEDKFYHVAHHSFITYKNKIVDWTYLYHPPNYYRVDQYFGVAYSLETVDAAFSEIAATNPEGNGLTIPLVVLKDKPFLK